MEYCKEGSLFDVMSHFYDRDSKRLSERLVRSYFHQLIDALYYMHSHGIIHRDLKPENLVLDENFCLKVTDYSMARRTK